jgi:hypothetical protein
MNQDLQRAKGANPVNARSASVPGFALRIGQRATLVPSPNSRSYGILMQLTHEEIDKLYSEPSVIAYRPEPVEAELGDGSRLAALCFNLPGGPSPAEANPTYAAKLRDLALQLGFPSHYIENIR